MKTKLLLFSILFICFSCTVSPKKIDYGKDACHYCKMTIVEKTHASQTVTKKGKNYKYDAIECMIKDLASKEESTFAYILVSDFSSPGTLINATEAFYLVSNQIKSPMGENLSAFKNIEKTTYFVGNNYNWTTIKEHLKKSEK